MGRYTRHAFIDWFDQERLRAAQVIVVGAGAVGNEVLKNLALLGVGHLHVFDFDAIEDHNLTRAVLFREADIGRGKAEAAAEACREIDPNIQVEFSPVDFWDGLTLAEIRAADGVVCCVDNYEARIALNQLCLLMKTDFYNTGIDNRHVTAEIYPFSTDPDCACYECALAPSVYDGIARRYSCGWLRRVAVVEKKIPTTAITASLAGSIAVSALLNRICGHPEAVRGAVRYYQDVICYGSTVSAFRRAEGCVGCGLRPRATLHLLARRACAANPPIPSQVPPEGQITFSEAILTQTTCVGCGREEPIYASTRGLTDAIACCAYCGSSTIETEIIHGLPAGAFAARFSGRQVPCKYLTLRLGGETILIEMED